MNDVIELKAVVRSYQRGSERIREIVRQSYRAVFRRERPTAESPLYPPEHPAWKRISAAPCEVRT